MPSKIDALLDSIGDLREDIGGFRADIANLRERAKDDRDQFERFHSDNQKEFGQLRDATQVSMSALRVDMNKRFSETAILVEDLSQKIDRHEATVTLMRPQIAAALQFTRARLVTLGSIGLVALTGLAWLVEAAIRWAVDRVLSMKFGG